MPKTIGCTATDFPLFRSSKPARELGVVADAKRPPRYPFQRTPTPMKIFVLKNLWWIAFGIAFILLIDHSFKIVNLTVDTNSILLLVVMLLSPFIAAIKKIKFGDFEAEIDIDEIRKIKSETEKTLNETQEDREERPEIYATSDSIKALVESDPVIALAKIRIELEKILGQLARFNSVKVSGFALGTLINKLANQQIISHDVGKALREVIALCNRAIHGEAISEEGARTIVDVGVELLEELYWIARNQASTGTIVKEEIIPVEPVRHPGNHPLINSPHVDRLPSHRPITPSSFFEPAAAPEQFAH